MMLRKLRTFSILLIMSLLFSGCARRPEDLLNRDGVVEQERDEDTGAMKASHNSEQKIGYQFCTSSGETVTIQSNSNYHWYVPTSYLNMDITAAPVECLTPDDIVITFGFADRDTFKTVDDNVYNILYLNILDNFVKQLGRGDKIRKQLKKSLDMYTTETYKIGDHEVIKSIADYTFFDKDATSYQLPCLQTSIPISDNEKVVIFVQASTSTGLWDRTVLPTPFELELGQKFSMADIDVLKDVKSQCSKYYKKLDQYMQEAISLVSVGDNADKLKIISLNYTNNYGIDVTRFNRFCFLRLTDGSVYLLYEKDNMHAAEFVTGNKQHRLTTDWTQFDKEVTDEYDGTIYQFEWESNSNE